MDYCVLHVLCAERKSGFRVIFFSRIIYIQLSVFVYEWIIVEKTSCGNGQFFLRGVAKKVVFCLIRYIIKRGLVLHLIACRILSSDFWVIMYT